MKYLIIFLLSSASIASTGSTGSTGANGSAKSPADYDHNVYLHYDLDNATTLATDMVMSIGETHITFRSNGEILRNGKLITRDKDLVAAFKEFVQGKRKKCE